MSGRPCGRSLLAPRAKDLGEQFTPAVHGALVELLHAAGSDLVLFLVQDLLGVRDRINVPSTIGPHNWTYRLPAPVEELRRDGRLLEILSMFRRGAERAGRLGD
ncbi:MAG: 4-alpha-glucanotransferase [Polyangiaceae bacterium]